MKESTNLLPVMFGSPQPPPPPAAADGDSGGGDGDDDGGGDDDDVAEGLEEFMIRANGGICILLHMSLPNGRLHAEEMMIAIIEHGAQANTHTHTHTSVLLESCREENKGGEEAKREGNK